MQKERFPLPYDPHSPFYTPRPKPGRQAIYKGHFLISDPGLMCRSPKFSVLPTGRRFDSVHIDPAAWIPPIELSSFPPGVSRRSRFEYRVGEGADHDSGAEPPENRVLDHLQASYVLFEGGDRYFIVFIASELRPT